MAKPLKIFFIGRRHGVIPFKARPWKLESRRPGELAGFKETRGIARTYSAARADVIFVRNKQEYTSEKHIRNIEKKISRFRKEKLILNDIEYFRNYNSKEVTFSIWQNNGLPIPAFKILDISYSEQNFLKEVKDFLALYPCMIIRSTNDESGYGMFFIDSGMSEVEIIEKVRECRDYIIQKKGLRTDGGVMAVEYIGDCRSPEHQYLCRAYCVGSEIVAMRCLTGKQHNQHAKSMNPDDFDEFMKMNTTVVPLLKKDPYKSQIVKAVECLDIRVTAIDFIYKNNAIFFLEVNPMWAGGNNFGNVDFKSILKQKRSSLQKQIPDIYELIDGAPFFKRFYETIRDYTREYYSRVSE